MIARSASGLRLVPVQRRRAWVEWTLGGGLLLALVAGACGGSAGGALGVFVYVVTNNHSFKRRLTVAKRQIVLTVTFKAEYQGTDEELLDIADDLIAEETTSLVIPQMEDKYVVLPKVLEGVTCTVIAAHQNNINRYYSEKAEREHQERERAKMLPFPNTGTARR